MANSKVCFITNNVKGLQSSKKRLKVIEYLKNRLESNGVLFLQERHPVSDDENAWVLMMILKVSFFLRMVHPTPVVF